MRTPDRATLEALRAAEGDRIEIIETDALVIVAKPSSRDHYAEYAAGVISPKTRPAAERNLIERCRLWPSASEVDAVLRDFPAMSEEIADQLDAMACGACRRRGLDTLTAEERAELVKLGCDLDTLKAKYPREGQLFLLAGPAGLWLLRRPSVPSYDLFREGRDGGSAYAPHYALTLESVAWPDETTVRAALERFPGLALACALVLENAARGGGGARRKKIGTS